MENLIATKPMLCPRCLTCKHWEQKTFYTYENAKNTGRCKELNTSDYIEIELHTGWDGGYVDEIRTESDFGCVAHSGNGAV